MKKMISILLAAGLLAVWLGGCGKDGGSDSRDMMDAALDKAEQVEFFDGDGNLLRTVTDGEEITALFESVVDSAGWDWVDGPEGQSPVELSAVFSQRPTQTVLGPKVGEDDREELLRLTVYEGSSIAEFRVLLFTLCAELPDSALDALRAAAGIA